MFAHFCFLHRTVTLNETISEEFSFQVKEFRKVFLTKLSQVHYKWRNVVFFFLRTEHVFSRESYDSVKKSWIHLKYLHWVQTKINYFRTQWIKLNFFTLTQNKTKILWKKILEKSFSNERHEFPNCQGFWTLPSQRLVGILTRLPKIATNSAAAGNRLFPPSSRPKELQCSAPSQLWEAEVWTETPSAILGFALCICTPSSSAPRKSRCWGLHSARAQPLQGTVLLCEPCQP